MFKKRFISILALLCLTVSGAWAQEVTLLTTIESTGDNASFKSGSKTFDNIATVTFSGNVLNDGDEWGWFSESECTLTVTAAEGYTITRVKFYTDSSSAFDEEYPFEAILVNDYGYFAKVNGNSIGEYGVTKIEVYGYAGTPEPATVAVTGVTLAPTSATLTLGETETVTLIPTVLPDDATDKSVAWSSSNEAVATVTDGVVTAVAAGTATITVTTTDGAKTATCAVTVAAPAASTYTVTLKEGTEDATSWTIAPAEATTTGVEAGTEVKATYSGMKKVKSVKAVKKAQAAAYTMAAAATSADKGKLICADGHIHANGADAACTKARVAKIIYIGTTGHATYSHGLALALTDEGQMAWGAAMTACNTTKNTNTPVTDATWLLASKDQWNYMKGINGAGSASALRTGFEDVSGTNMVADEYWSSTEDEDDCMWVLDFNMGVWNSCDKSGKRYVRSALAF